MRLIPTISLALCAYCCLSPTARSQDLLPKHITPQTQAAIEKGLEFLAKTQSQDGSFTADNGGQTYPVCMTSLAGMALLAGGNTPSRGPYSERVARIIEFLTHNVQPSGLITGPTQENGYSMYGHGFALMFLSSCYGMETDDRTRSRMKRIITDAIHLTAGASWKGAGATRPPPATKAP